MAKFKNGQQVVCINDGWFVSPRLGNPDQSNTGPKENEIVTVCGYSDCHKEFLRLVEYKFDSLDGAVQYFHEEDFAPLADISELTEILKSEDIEV